MNKNTNNKNNNSTLNPTNICLIAMFVALICIMAQMTILLPMGVPITMQTFAIILASVILGPKLSVIAVLVYLLLGAIGVPVLSGFGGGLEKIVGPTGGFLLSFPIMAFIIGLGSANYFKKYSCGGIVALTLGILTNYAFGILFFCFTTKTPIHLGFTTCILPFIPTDIIKTVLAYVLGLRIKKQLSFFYK